MIQHRGQPCDCCGQPLETLPTRHDYAPFPQVEVALCRVCVTLHTPLIRAIAIAKERATNGAAKIVTPGD